MTQPNFNPIEFNRMYPDEDKSLYQFLIHSSIREFYRQLKPLGFNPFDHKPKTIVVQPQKLEECECIGVAFFHTDEIKLQLPRNPSALVVSNTASVITHELGHHYVQEYYGDSAVGNRLGNNLVHWESNRISDDYRYSKLFNSMVFARKYLLPFARVRFPNLALLIRDKDMIQAEIANGAKGFHAYW